MRIAVDAFSVFREESGIQRLFKIQFHFFASVRLPGSGEAGTQKQHRKKKGFGKIHDALSCLVGFFRMVMFNSSSPDEEEWSSMMQFSGG